MTASLVSPVDEASPAAPPVAPTPPPVDAAVLIEIPYKVYERPRATGVVFAAGEDESLARWNVGGTGDPDFISNRPAYHPGSRVVVDTNLVSGSLPEKSRHGLSQRGIVTQSRSSGYWPMRICFEDALRRNPKLRGATRLRVTIGRSGAIVRARLRDTELDQEAGRCLVLAAESLAYSPGPSGVVAIDLSVKFWPGDAPVPSDGPPPGTVFENPGRLDKATVAATFESALDSIKACYLGGLTRDQGLWGRIELEVQQAEDGTIEDVHEAGSRFPDPVVTQCLVHLVQALPLPVPPGGPLSFIQGVRFGAPPTQGSEEPEASSSP